jgi:hypothetical protein
MYLGFFERTNIETSTVFGLHYTAPAGGGLATVVMSLGLAYFMCQVTLTANTRTHGNTRTH